MDGNNIQLFLNDWLGTILDAGLICGFFLLWLSWFRNGKRQQRLEQMLLETSSQLDEATRHLSQATEAIEHLSNQDQPRPSGRERVDTVAYATQPYTTQPYATQQASSPAPATPRMSTLPAQSSTQATMILRMQREGESPQTIAERLDMPLAQVKLLLKLHAASASIN